MERTVSRLGVVIPLPARAGPASPTESARAVAPVVSIRAVGSAGPVGSAKPVAGAARLLDHLNGRMREFIGRQEMMFVANPDGPGQGYSSFRAGPPGFVVVHDAYRLSWPDYQDSAVLAGPASGQISLFFVGFFRDIVGLHVNGDAAVVEAEDLRRRHPDLPAEPIPGRRPERWVTVHVEDAYIHCARPGMRLARRVAF